MTGSNMPGKRAGHIIRLERDILSKNGAFARANRDRLKAAGVFALNLISSPGSGKTSLLVRAIADLGHRFPINVIEGSPHTSNADRIHGTGIHDIQITTGWGGCLDAHMVGHALDQLPLTPGSLLFIENVGNLVCPAAVDLGESHKVVVLSVTEGDDKPLKYPDVFAESDLMLLNKVDLLPYVDFDIGRCRKFALRVNPQIQIINVSARTGEGLPAFCNWLEWRSSLARRPAYASV